MDTFSSMKISMSGMTAQRTRLNVISSNLANVETTRTPQGGPYRKQEVVFRTRPLDFGSRLDSLQQGQGAQEVEVSRILPSPKPPKLVFDPDHPDADGDGMVAKPNIEVVEEMVDMMTATRSYEANITAVESAKRMALKALEIGR